MADDEENLDSHEIGNNFGEFLRECNGDDVYRDRFEQMVEKGVYRLLVDMNDLRTHDPELAQNLLKKPIPHILAFQEALETFMTNEYGDKDFAGENARFHVGFIGSFGSHLVSPRAMLANYLGQMICLEGIVTKVSGVRPKLVSSTHYCEVTNKHTIRSYRDGTSIDGLPTNAVPPKKDTDNNPLQMEFGESEFKDHQTVTIQEMPERAPLGQLPRSVDAILDYDLVDTCKPGDRIQVVGVFRAMNRGLRTTFYGSTLIANSVQGIGNDVQGLTMTPGDLKNIRALAQSEDAFETISRSLAPSIYGHSYIKKALLLMLLGGMEKNLENGAHLRGDINILLVGDPSTAKSQLLRFILGIAPLAVSTTGRGSSGVGLTAAVTEDPDTRERRLEAGAMVLADRGVVCIDEFDKMSQADRVAIHEVMEQQTVTIAKAGIHASLNARCSVVAAANPILGNYAKNEPVAYNVNLPDSLLSRFDLLFIVLDNLGAENDREIADHMLRLHRYQKPGHEGIPMTGGGGGGDGGQMALEEDDDREDMTAPMYQKFDPLLHGGYASQNKSRRDELLHPEFIRKYIHYAKSRIKPVLSAEACEYIDEEYARLREEHDEKTLPITARQLESFIRLATAHAKARLSNVVEVVDSEQALRIMRNALYKQNMEPLGHENDDSGKVSGDDAPDSDDDDMSSGKKKRAVTQDKTKLKRRKQNENDPLASNTLDNEDGEDHMLGLDINGKTVESEDDGDDEIIVDETSERYKAAQDTISKLFRKKRTDSLAVDDVYVELRKLDSANLYRKREVDAILKIMEDRNRIMFRDGILFQV